jgi:hypothetical protein
MLFPGKKNAIALTGDALCKMLQEQLNLRNQPNAEPIRVLKVTPDTANDTYTFQVTTDEAIATTPAP